MAALDPLTPLVATSLQQHRVAMSVSQKELAYRLGVDQCRVSLVEHPRNSLTLRTIHQIASALGLHVKIDFVPIQSTQTEEGSPNS